MHTSASRDSLGIVGLPFNFPLAPLAPMVTCRSRALRAAIVALAACAVGLVTRATVAAGGSSDWIAPLSGSFGDPARWTPGVPGPRDEARFGVTGSTVPFDVSLDESVTIGSWIIANQSPRFIASRQGRGPRPIIALNGSVLMGGPPPTPPVVRFDGVDCLATSSFAVGPFGLNGSLHLRDALLTVHGIDIGISPLISMGSGTLVVEAGGRVALGDATLPIRVGESAVGNLRIEPGGEIALQGGGLLVGRNAGGFGTLTVEHGGAIRLGGGQLVIGATDAGGSGGANGIATIEGLVEGPGSIVVGRKSTGVLTLADGVVFGDDVDVAVGVFGGVGSLVVTAPVNIRTLTAVLSAAGGAPGAVSVAGPTADARVKTLTVANAPFGSPPVSVSIVGGGTLEAEETTCTAGGHIAALGGPLGASFSTGAFSIAPTVVSEARLSATGLGSTVTLPAVTLTEKQRLALLASEGGLLVVTSASIGGSPSSTGGIRCEVTAGGRIVVDGELDLRAGKLSRITVGPSAELPFGGAPSGGDEGGAAADSAMLQAASIVTGPESNTSFVLPFGGGGAPIVANEVSIGGSYAVTVANGWTPSGTMDIRLVASPAFSIGGYPTSTPSFFGFPSVVVQDDDGLLLRIIDGIDGFDVPSRVRVAVGQTITIPTIVVIDGEAIDVSAQAVWSLTPAANAARLGPASFAGLLEGTTTATVTFGAAQTTVAFEIAPSADASFVLASGAGFNVGNNESGWQGPDFFAGPFGLGPRSMNASGGRIAFTSLAGNLVAGDGSATDDFFTHDLATSVILRHSVPSDGGGGGPWLGTNLSTVAAPALSADGRYLVGTASGSIDGLSDARIFWVDTLTGEREIIAGNGGSGTGWNSFISRVCVSDDGRFVAFTSRATDLVAGDTNGVADVFLRDRELGTTVRVSLTPAGGQTIGANGLTDMTPDGRFVTFLRSIGLFRLAYRYDRLTGEIVTISPGLADETPSITVLDAQLSPDGSEVLFIAQGAEPIVPIPPGGSPAIGYQLYRWAEAVPPGEHPVTPLTRRGDGVWANAPIEGFASSLDGRFIAIATKASNLTLPGPGIGDGRTRLLRLDRTAAVNAPGSPAGDPVIGSHRWQHLSLVADGPLNNDVHPALAMSGDGTFVTFVTRATNVQPFDTALFNDVFRCQAPIPPLGDLDGDGVVGSADLATLLGLWGSDDPILTGGDLDGDGSVGITDLAILLGAWSA